MKKLSVVIITFNEEDNIGRCIDSVQSVADEIVVVDSFSTDNTIKVSEEKGARVIQHKFEGYTAQKNFAVSASVNNFVLSLDADEVVSAELLLSIKNAKAYDFDKQAYEMNRLNHYGNQPIKTAGWYPDTKVRLWNKAAGGWTGGLVHEKWEFNQTKRGVTPAKLAGDLYHYSYKNKKELSAQADKFATLAAHDLKNRNPFSLFIKLLFSPLFRFIKTYFLLLGFTEGIAGFYICFFQSREVYLKYLRALKFKYA